MHVFCVIGASLCPPLCARRCAALRRVAAGRAVSLLRFDICARFVVVVASAGSEYALSTALPYVFFASV